MPTLYQIIFIALIAAFVVLITSKTMIRYKVRDLCDENQNVKAFKYISKMLDCDFCFGFWSAFFIAVIMAFMTHDISWLFVPILSAPITRFLI